MTSSDSQLFLDTFTINSFDQSKYDRVARIKGISSDQTTEFSLDINTDLYRLSDGETIELSLVSTLNLDGSKDDEKGTWRDNAGESTLADLWDYVCYGKVYRFEEGSAAAGGQEIM
jgi:DNA-directed RNA polymerase I, II, and III subunit RPABC3